jgi:hypothetical protein
MRLKVGDTAPALAFDLNADASGVTSATVRMENAASGILKITAGTVAWDNQALGQGHYDWQAADTNTEGRFLAEIRLVYSNGKIQRFPQRGYLEVDIAGNAG